MCSPQYDYNCATLGFCNIFDQSFTRSTHHTNNAHGQLVSAANCCFFAFIKTLHWRLFQRYSGIWFLEPGFLSVIWNYVWYISSDSSCSFKRIETHFDFLFCATEFVKIRFSLIKEGCGSVRVTKLGLCTSVTLEMWTWELPKKASRAPFIINSDIFHVQR